MQYKKDFISFFCLVSSSVLVVLLLLFPLVLFSSIFCFVPNGILYGRWTKRKREEKKKRIVIIMLIIVLGWQMIIMIAYVFFVSNFAPLCSLIWLCSKTHISWSSCLSSHRSNILFVWDQNILLLSFLLSFFFSTLLLFVHRSFFFLFATYTLALCLFVK